MGCTIIGSGKALPQKVVTNDDLAMFLDTSDEWIVERTGIRARHIATNQTATSLGAAAARRALGMEDGILSEPDEGIESVGLQLGGKPIDPLSIDLVLCSTFSPDTAIPSTAASIQNLLGLDNAIAFDINAACAGCIYGLETSSRMLAASTLLPHQNRIRRALVIGTERMSRHMDWTDRTTCILFGDGAGAAVLEWNPDRPGIMASYLRNDFDEVGALTTAHVYDLSTFPFFDDDVPLPENAISAIDFRSMTLEATDSDQFQGTHFMAMNGQKVFRYASETMVETLTEALDRVKLTIGDLACIVPHQANERIIRYTAKKMDIPMDLFQISIGDVGNTSSASIFMALCDAYLGGRIHRDDYVALVGFGGGFTAGAMVFQSE